MEENSRKQLVNKRWLISYLVGRSWRAWKVYAERHGCSPFDVSLIRGEIVMKFMGVSVGKVGKEKKP